MLRKDPLFWSLGFLLIVQWVALSFGVEDRTTWIVENILPLLLIAPCVWLYWRGVLSKTSMVLIYVFLALHIVGAHYTYSKVPYDTWSETLLGIDINSIFHWERNHYDRLIHFLFGFLFYQPLKESFYYFTKIDGWVLVALSILSLHGASTLYEMIEWGSTYVLADGSMEFLGTQGDVWDAHKDMALATTGATLAALIFTKKKSLIESQNP